MKGNCSAVLEKRERNCRYHAPSGATTTRHAAVTGEVWSCRRYILIARADIAQGRLKVIVKRLVHCRVHQKRRHGGVVSIAVRLWNIMAALP